jgi:hypothetical protein
MLFLKDLFEGIFSRQAHMYGRNMLPSDTKRSLNKIKKTTYNGIKINKKYLPLQKPTFLTPNITGGF